MKTVCHVWFIAPLKSLSKKVNRHINWELTQFWEQRVMEGII